VGRNHSTRATREPISARGFKFSVSGWSTALADDIRTPPTSCTGHEIIVVPSRTLPATRDRHRLSATFLVGSDQADIAAGPSGKEVGFLFRE
jgi:hypothetical protein